MVKWWFRKTNRQGYSFMCKQGCRSSVAYVRSTEGEVADQSRGDLRRGPLFDSTLDLLAASTDHAGRNRPCTTLLSAWTDAARRYLVNPPKDECKTAPSGMSLLL